MLLVLFSSHMFAPVDNFFRWLKIHSFIQAISITALQVHYYSEGVPDYTVGVCGYTRTRGFTRFRSAGTGRVRNGYTFRGSGRVRVWSWRVRVYPVFTRTNLTF